MTRVAIIGDGIFCKSMLDLLFSEDLLFLGIELIGLASSDSSSSGYRYALQKGIFTTDNYQDLLQIDRLDLIIMLTEKQSVADELLHVKPDHVYIIDYVTAQLLLNIFQCVQEKLYEYRASTDSLKKDVENYWALFDSSVAALFRTRIDDGTLLMCNSRLSDILGFDNREEAIGTYNVALNYVDPTRRDDLLAELKKNGKVDSFEFQQKSRDGTVFCAELSAKMFPKKGYLEGMLTDISARKKAEEENKYLTQRLLSIQEEERARIARDLHDELGQALSTLQFGMEALKDSLPNGLEKQEKICHDIIGNIEHIGNTVRNISYELRPDMLDQLGLIPTIEWFFEGFKHRNPEVKLAFQVMGFKKRLESEIEIVLYRLLQEALNNIQKHARARKINIILTFSYPEVILTVKDDGIGFNMDQTSTGCDHQNGGIGLLGMRERIVSVGGSLDIRSRLGKGTAIRAIIKESQIEALNEKN